MVFCAYRLRDGYRRAHRKPHEHDRQHMHHLRADGHRRRRLHARVLSDDEQIRHTVERLQKIGQQIRQRKPHDIL